jgi:NADH dehydrogenase
MIDETIAPEKKSIGSISATLPRTGRKRIVIVGGGFAGIEFIRKLKQTDYEVIMIDKNNYHSFIPLLYQVATAGLSPGDISSPLREFIQDHPHFHFRLAGIENIDHERNLIHTTKGELEYDILVMATGSVTNFYGNEKIEESSLKLREIKDALNLRNTLIDRFEEALLLSEEQDQQAYLNVVIVGAGPTGVELAGAIGELKRHILPKDYPELDFSMMKIFLVEGLDQVLPAMSEQAGKKAHKYLNKFDVQVMLGKMVDDVKDQTVVLSDGEEIHSNCLIWTAGVKGNMVPGLPDGSSFKSQYVVDAYNLVEGTDNVYAIGDVSLQKNPDFEQGLPMLAPVAIQQAKHLGENFVRKEKGRSLKPFEYLDKGTMATVGRNKAIVDFPFNFTLGGFAGWFIWMFVHLMSIVGFRRKLLVFSNWVWNYITYNKGNRLIIPREKEA